jgi:hypothetical protein
MSITRYIALACAAAMAFAVAMGVGVALIAQVFVKPDRGHESLVGHRRSLNGERLDD